MQNCVSSFFLFKMSISVVILKLIIALLHEVTYVYFKMHLLSLLIELIQSS